MKAVTFAADSSGKMTEGDVPAAMADEAKIAREQLIEMVAEADETLMETFFAEGTLTQEQLVSGCAPRPSRAGSSRWSARRDCTSSAFSRCSTPWWPTSHRRRSATSRCWQGWRRDVGQGERQRALHGVCVEDDRRSVRRAHHDAARRVGALKSDTTVHNFTHDSAERLGHLIALQGKTHTHVPELKAGDLGAVAKLKETKTNDVLAEKSAAVKFTEIKFPEPVLSYAIEPKSRGDEDKISTAMQRLREEDPTIGYTRDPQTHELLLAGQGQLHIEVTVAKLKRRFGVEVNLKPPRIPYRETITASTEAHGRHKKQTGGHGQFGDCKIR